MSNEKLLLLHAEVMVIHDSVTLTGEAYGPFDTPLEVAQFIQSRPDLDPWKKPRINALIKLKDPSEAHPRLVERVPHYKCWCGTKCWTQEQTDKHLYVHELADLPDRCFATEEARWQAINHARAEFALTQQRDKRLEVAAAYGAGPNKLRLITEGVMDELVLKGDDPCSKG